MWPGHRQRKPLGFSLLTCKNLGEWGCLYGIPPGEPGSPKEPWVLMTASSSPSPHKKEAGPSREQGQSLRVSERRPPVGDMAPGDPAGARGPPPSPPAHGAARSPASLSVEEATCLQAGGR